MFLLVVGFCLVIPIGILNKDLTYRVNKTTGLVQNNEEDPTASIIVQYISPTLMFFANFLIMPFIIFKLVFHENNHKYS